MNDNDECYLLKEYKYKLLDLDFYRIINNKISKINKILVVEEDEEYINILTKLLNELRLKLILSINSEVYYNGNSDDDTYLFDEDDTYYDDENSDENDTYYDDENSDEDENTYYYQNNTENQEGPSYYDDGDEAYIRAHYNNFHDDEE